MKNLKEIFKPLTLHTALVPLIYISGVYTVIKETDYPISTEELSFSIVLIILITILCYFLLKYILKDKIKAAVAATLFLAFVFNAVSLSKFLAGDNLLPVLSDTLFGGNRFYASASILLLIFVLLTYFLYKISFRLLKFNNYLNVLLLIFLVFEIINFFSFQPRKMELEERIEAVSGSNTEIQNLPDIYYIVFDSYTNFTSLEKYWGYSNSELYDFLKGRDFYIARDSRSSYNQTHFTLASTLNLSYLKYESFNELTTAHYPNLFRLIKDNALVKIFEQHGYKTTNLSLFDIARTTKFYRFDLIDEPRFLKNTLFEHVIDVELIGAPLGFDFKPELRKYKINRELAVQIKDTVLKNRERRNFVYTHFMIPHPPYYFDADGNLMPDDYAGDKDNMWKYLKQLKYANRILMETINFIFDNSEEKPVIIIQGDHGFRSLEDKKERGAESHSILNAFYFPDGDYNLLYPEISSVNTFRVMLKKFGLADIELLPDKRFFVAKGIGF
jgi:hypothetical protein